MTDMTGIDWERLRAAARRTVPRALRRWRRASSS